MKKLCVKCKQELPVSEFYLKGNGKYHSYCNTCKREIKKQWQKDNKEHIKEYKARTKEYRDKKDAEYREKNRELCRQRVLICNEKRKDKIREYYQKPEVKERVMAYGKQWRETHREYANQYAKKRRESDPCFKIAHNLRNRL